MPLSEQKKKKTIYTRKSKFYVKFRRIQDQREKDTQKLREKQERAQDKQADLDGVRAKRAFEDAERKARERERKEIRDRVKY
jgi:hypothetical protein